MKILRRKDQNELLASLGVIQHRVMEAMPVMGKVRTLPECEYFFETIMECIGGIADMVDPDIGTRFLIEAFDKSYKAITKYERAGGKNDEQSDPDRKPGE